MVRSALLFISSGSVKLRYPISIMNSSVRRVCTLPISRLRVTHVMMCVGGKIGPVCRLLVSVPPCFFTTSPNLKMVSGVMRCFYFFLQRFHTLQGSWNALQEPRRSYDTRVPSAIPMSAFGASDPCSLSFSKLTHLPIVICGCFTAR